MAALRLFVTAMLMASSVMGVALVEEQSSMMPTQSCGDAHVTSLVLGSAELRRRVQSCAMRFRMNGPALELLMRNVPVRFDLFNARPRGCVEMDMTVEEVRAGSVQKRWQVIIDVDNKTKTQNAHYGYTVSGIKPKVPKATGHIFFPPNVVPPNVRPFIGEKKGQKVHFADHINAPASRTVYRLSGIMFNQYKTRPSPDDDVSAVNEDIFPYEDISPEEDDTAPDEDISHQDDDTASDEVVPSDDDDTAFHEDIPLLIELM